VLEGQPLQVRTNADTPEQTANAIAFGATGIGLCRTEHMFFEGDRIDAMREMILAEKTEDRKKALAKLLPYQKRTSSASSKRSKGFPATIRFLDPPLHEFLPHDHAAQNPGREDGRPWTRSASASRNCTSSIRCSGSAAAAWASSIPKSPRCRPARCSKPPPKCRKKGIKVKPEIMIPLVGFKKELDLQVELVHRVAKEVMAEKKVKLNYLVGTMIEVPRGALTADEIAADRRVLQLRHQRPHPDRLGMSRDDSGSFLPPYQELEIVKKNPFAPSTNRRGPADEDRRERAAAPGPTSSSASAANTAATRIQREVLPSNRA
jgi:pyruvate, orthophosphate dikinase